MATYLEIDDHAWMLLMFSVILSLTPASCIEIYKLWTPSLKHLPRYLCLLARLWFRAHHAWLIFRFELATAGLLVS